MVARQKRRFVRSSQFLCDRHGIFISPTTFEYQDYRDNLLAPTPEDLRLLKKIFVVKRETDRLGRERSEDALTFNTFRTLERANGVGAYLSSLSGRPQRRLELAYWSYSPVEESTHPWLEEARAAFGEREGRGSEPDLLITTSDSLFLFEVKLTARNDTVPTRPEVLTMYGEAQEHWYDHVFRSDPRTVAIELRRYQLMRLWLLGTWMADGHARRFHLVNLVRTGKDCDGVERFRRHLITTPRRTLICTTWENLLRVARSMARVPGIPAMIHYLEGKTVGFDHEGRLRLAFPNR